LDHRFFAVVGNDLGGFFEFSAAVASRLNLDADFPLAAGGDLSRKRDSRTTSAGPHVGDQQWRPALILDDKIVHDVGPLDHGRKFKNLLREKNSRNITGARGVLR
jgi:hypothetical protein